MPMFKEKKETKKKTVKAAATAAAATKKVAKGKDKEKAEGSSSKAKEADGQVIPTASTSSGKFESEGGNSPQKKAVAAPSKFAGAPPPPPSATSTAPKVSQHASTGKLSQPKPAAKSATASSAPPRGFWTQRHLPGFEIDIPKERIKKDKYTPGLPMPPRKQPPGSGGPKAGVDPVGGWSPSFAHQKHAAAGVDPDDPNTWTASMVVEALQDESREATGEVLPAHEAIVYFMRLTALGRSSEAERASAVRAGALGAVCMQMATLRAMERAAEAGCEAVRVLLDGKDTKDVSAGDGGEVIETVIEMMGAHPKSTCIATHACVCIRALCSGSGVEVTRRRERAVESGVMRTLSAALALKEDGDATALLQVGCQALSAVCSALVDKRAEARREAGAKAGIMAVLAKRLGALETGAWAAVAEVSGQALSDLVAGSSEAADARRQAAADAGIVSAISKAMSAWRTDAPVQVWGCFAITSVLGGAGPKVDARRTAVAEMGAIGASLGALKAHPMVEDVQSRGFKLLRQLCAGDDVAAGTRSDVSIHLGMLVLVVKAFGRKELSSNPTVLSAGCEVITAACAKNVDGRDRRQQQAAEAGCVEALVRVIKKNKATDAAQFALARATDGQPKLAQRALDAGAQPEWLQDAEDEAQE